MTRLASKASIIILLALVASNAAADGAPQNGAFGSGDTGSNGVSLGPSSSAAWANQLASVDATTGAAHAAFPIDLPPARGGVQPHVSLNYSSDAGDGEAGAGWHLSLPSIERRDPAGGPAPTYVDQDARLPTQSWDHFDRFVYNGQPLVPICNIRAGLCGTSVEAFPPFVTSGFGWIYYRLQVDDGSAIRFFLSPDRLTWIVQLPRSNETLEFGNPQDGHGLGAPIDYGDATHAFRWHLSRQYDNQRVNGAPTNPIVYLWSQGLLTDVFDTAPVGAGAFDVNAFAHHTHLWYHHTQRYPSAAPPWRWVPDQVLSHVDVASKRWNNIGARELVRRYNFTYTGTASVSDLVYGNHPTMATIQLEGRCVPGPVLEAPLPANAAINALPDRDPGCPTLPPTSMLYTQEAPHAPPVSELDRSEGVAADWKQVDTGIYAWVARPTIVADFNQDGFADVLVPPEDGSTQQKLYLNDGQQLVAQPVNAPAAPSVSFANAKYLAPGIQPAGNWFGDGSLNVLASNTVPWHRDPYAGDSQQSKDPPSVLTADLFSFQMGTPSTWLNQPNHKMSWEFRFKNNPAAMLIGSCDPVDINGDGLVDCWVQEDHWQGDDYKSSYGWIGEGVYFTTQAQDGTITPPFGTISNLAPDDTNNGGMLGLQAVANNTPMRMARLRSYAEGTQGNPIQSLPYYWADMDGDGLIDVVFPWQGQLTYWRGNGLGWFGIGTCVSQANGAPACAYGANAHGMAMSGLPVDANWASNVVYLHDLNGDGFADYIVTNEGGITIYFNSAGVVFNPDQTIFIPTDHTAGEEGGQLPRWFPNQGGRLAFADMNGSGVDDLVLLGAVISYFDFAQSTVPDKLVAIVNGLGASETIDYVSDASFGNPIWQTKQIVRDIQNDNFLTNTPDDVHEVRVYDYSNPIYDVRSRMLRGFAHGSVSISGANDSSAPAAPGSSVVTDYLLAAPPMAIAHESSATGIDDPYATLRGLPTYETVCNDSFTSCLKSTHTQYQVRRLYTGQDGRVVRLIYPEQTDTIFYDASSALAAGAPASMVDVDAPADPLLASVGQHAPVATKGVAIVRSSVHLDNHGNPDVQTNYGRVSSGFGLTSTGPTDRPIITQSDFSTPVGDPGAWSWKPHSTTVYSGTFNRILSFQYDGVGNLNGVNTILSGTTPLNYAHEAGKPVAPQPSQMAADGLVTAYAVQSIDLYGNVTESSGANGTTCARVDYDSAFAQFPVYASTGCSSPTLDAFSLTYDVGLGRATTTSGTSNDVSKVVYDSFGRPSQVYDADLATPGMASTSPSMTTEYVQDISGHVLRTHTTAQGQESWSLTDGLGHHLATFVTGDARSDGASWIASDSVSLHQSGVPRVSYSPFAWTGDNPRTVSVATFLASLASHPGQVVTYDGFGRVVRLVAADATTLLQASQFHALSAVISDGEDALPNGLHANTPTTVHWDGFGRTDTVMKLEKHANVLDQITTTNTWLPTGELDTVTRTHTAGADGFLRHNTYDSMGRMTSTTEPNSDAPRVASGILATWTYAYDYAGHLVGASDARGCGKNVLYDDVGRPVSYDVSPCLSAQAPYTPPSANGDGTEAFFVYDHADTGQTLTAIETAAAEGRLTAIYDQGAHTQLAYDGRGKPVQVTRQIATPSGASALTSRYSTTAFPKQFVYDSATEHLINETTGAQDPSFNANGPSVIGYGYTARGQIASVQSSYGVLVSSATYDPSGRRLGTNYGDAAATAKLAHFTAAGLLDSLIVVRGPGPWAKATGTYAPPAASLGAPSSQQLLINDSFAYDLAGNPTVITDGRLPEWPSGAKPVSRSLVYDDAYRLTQAKYNSGGDVTGPAMVGAAAAMPLLEPVHRVAEQDFAYDWMGNTTSTTSDDATNAFFDRSLGTITNGLAGSKPNQLTSAVGPGGTVSAAYDAAGNMVSLLVVRSGACTDRSGQCTMRFVYDWDETNRLSRARRWGYAGAYTGPQPPLAPTSTPLVDVHYIYDAFGGRVVKSALPSHPPGKTSCGLLCQPKTTYNVEIFDTLHLSSATWTGSDYEDDDSTETVFIPAAEARVLNDTTGAMPAAGTGPHVFFEIGDHLGSTAAIVDKASGELVERDTYQAYGAAESDYQPARWAGFHEQYRFTGKEDDSEVGLTYFGARYYSAYLGRWISPDPLTVHAMGTDLNPYAYVAGRVTAATDPSGLQTDDENPSIDASLSQYQPVLGTFFNDQTSILTTGSNDPNASSSASSDTGAEGSRGGLSPAAYPFTGTAPGPWRPSGQPVPLYIGNTIHQNIAARYVEIHEPQGETVLTNSFPIGTILRRLGLPLPIEQIPSLALRPDIANLTLRQLYEIKPANDLAGGTSQLALYLGIFADNGMPFLPGSMSDPGAMGLVPAPGGWASYYSPVPGIILYNYMRFVQRASSSALSPTTAALLAAAAAIGTYMGIRMIPVPEGEVGGPISSGAPAYAY